MNRLFWSTVVLQSSFLVGCLGCHQAPSSNYDDSYKYERSYSLDEDKTTKDSVGEKTLNDAAEETSKAKAYTSSGSYSSRYDDEEEYDNMRGFDPASEDDMEDNGMTRYMENNDEEGWD